ncbi:hypothetical protein DSO57_1012734 [Entomophthora muscae]|uniref:Uncharacterized protein n=1 Tax=Entomophthora muscae TaxID=34485 RepID=A0ACC2U430_9FUNG|nr:hypothetical protein DSO57_1012734 [Entomophthora muscae]
MFFLLYASVSAGFYGNLFNWSHHASSVRPCGRQVASLESLGVIDTRCPLTVHGMSHTLPNNLNAKLLADMKYPDYHPKDYAAGSLVSKLRWSGKKLLSYEEPCRADEKCSFHVDFSEPQQWRIKFNLSLVLGTKPKDTPKWKTSLNNSYSVTFLGPTIASVYINQIMYEITWRRKSLVHVSCSSCRGDHKKVTLSPFYNNHPVGALFLHQRTLSS